MLNGKPEDFENKVRLSIPFFIYNLYVILVLLNDCLIYFNIRFTQIGIVRFCLVILLLYITNLIVKNYYYIKKEKLRACDIIIILLIIFMAFIKLPIPDSNFDTLNYHLYLQEPRFSNDINESFFPNGMWSYSFPLGDRLFYFFRVILGYRAGTLLNTLVLVIIYYQIQSIVKRLSKKYEIDVRPEIISLLALIVISTEYIFLNLSTYMVDLLYLPFLLEMLGIIMYDKKYSNARSCFLLLLSGISISIKLTSSVFVLVLLLIYFIKNYKYIPKIYYLLSPIIILFPVGIYVLYNYTYTYNPIFPYYNKIFKSVYFPLENFKDARWTPKNIFEYLFWPVCIFLKPERFSELAIYSGRITIGFICFVLYPFLNKYKTKEGVLLTVTFLFSLYLWIFSTGYVRYALFIELIAGIFVVISSLKLLLGKKYLKVIGLVFLSFIAIQSFSSYYYLIIKNADWSWRPSIFQDFNNYKNNFAMIGKDRFFSQSDNFLNYNNIGIWAIIDNNSGYANLLNNHVPTFDVIFGAKTDETRKLYKNYVNNLSLNRIFTIVRNNEMKDIIKILNAQEFKILKVYTVSPPFLPYKHKLNLLEIKKDVVKNDIYEIKDASTTKVFNIQKIYENELYITAIIGYDPSKYGSGSDGCKFNVSIINNDKEKEVYSKYIKPEDGFCDISFKISRQEISSDEFKVKFSISNDLGKNWDGDWLVILNPIIKSEVK